MSEQELERQAKHRLQVIRHAKEGHGKRGHDLSRRHSRGRGAYCVRSAEALVVSEPVLAC